MKLTVRDNLIIETLKNQDFCFYKDIEDHFFSSKYSAYKRLNELQKNHYIFIKPLKNLYLEKNMDSSLMNLIGNNRKYICLGEKFNIFRRKPSLWKINHQLLLFSSRKRLEDILNTKAVFENQIRDLKGALYDRTFEPFPDFYFQGENFKLAVELELSLKSQKRYFLKMSEYRKSSYSHVLYIITDNKKTSRLLETFRYQKYVAIAHYLNLENLISYRYGSLTLSEWLKKRTK